MEQLIWWTTYVFCLIAFWGVLLAVGIAPIYLIVKRLRRVEGV
jgi:hypothetical protein